MLVHVLLLLRVSQLCGIGHCLLANLDNDTNGDRWRKEEASVAIL